MKIIAFYNPKAGVGCTSLVYHLAWMYRELGLRVLVVDADPQGDLSGMLLGFDVYWWLGVDNPSAAPRSLADALLDGVSGGSYVHEIDDGVGVVVAGSLRLEDRVEESSDARALWYQAVRGGGARPQSAAVARARRLCVTAAEEVSADIVLVDVCPGLGLIPSLATTAADMLVMPLSADEPAVEGAYEGARSVSAWTLAWRGYVREIGDATKEPSSLGATSWLGDGPRLLGYAVTSEAHYGGYYLRMNESVLRTLPRMLDRALAEGAGATGEDEAWRERLQGAFAAVAADPRCLGVLRSYVSLRDLSLRARKPIFALSPADGALGSLAVAVSRSRLEYEALARTIAARAAIEL